MKIIYQTSRNQTVQDFQISKLKNYFLVKNPMEFVHGPVDRVHSVVSRSTE
jgi:hypothetical protein